MVKTGTPSAPYKHRNLIRKLSKTDPVKNVVLFLKHMFVHKYNVNTYKFCDIRKCTLYKQQC